MTSPSSAFTPSPYQAAIFDFDLATRGNLAVEAVAGSGKTTTAIQLLARYAAANPKHRCVFLAFSRAIATEMGEKIVKAGVRCDTMTIHSLGRKALLYRHAGSELVSGKYRALLKASIEGAMRAATNRGDRKFADALGAEYPLKALCKIVDLARLNLLGEQVDGGQVADLVARYDITPWTHTIDSFVLRAINFALADGLASASESHDYTDMLWVPAVQGWNCIPFDLVVVDECQDLSAVQRAIVGRAVRYGTGRLVAVGDRSQAIFGFCGADSDSFDRVVREFRCTVLPLSVCYRCPTSIVDIARILVPQIEARPGAPVGSVEFIEDDDLTGDLRGDELVLCRTTVPLISACYAAIRAGKPAYVVGRDIGQGLTETAEQVIKNAVGRGGMVERFNWSTFGSAADAWTAGERAKILARNDGDDEDPALDAVADKAECCAVIWAENVASIASLDDFSAVVARLFDPEVAEHPVRFSTAHRAKGLEADVVFILRPELMPFPKARTAEQVAQEWNLAYVAVTRAMKRLVVCGDLAWAKPQGDGPGSDGGEYPKMPPERAQAPSERPEPSSPTTPDADAFWAALCASGRAAEVERLWRTGETARAVVVARSIVPGVDVAVLAATLGPVWRGAAQMIAVEVRS